MAGLPVRDVAAGRAGCSVGDGDEVARGTSEFGAAVILAYHPKSAPVLVHECFQGFGQETTQPAAALLVPAWGPSGCCSYCTARRWPCAIAM
jgi:hypothetical protein